MIGGNFCDCILQVMGDHTPEKMLMEVIYAFRAKMADVDRFDDHFIGHDVVFACDGDCFICR